MDTPTPAGATTGSEAANTTTTNTNHINATAASASTSINIKPEPVTVDFTVGNTYRRLSPSEASYDKLTGRHLKVHDWTLYVDILPGQDPDIIDRVTFDFRDDSFATKAFTCHCPIRIRDGVGSSFIGSIAGGDNQNNSQTVQIGQSTSEAGQQQQEPDGPSSAAAAVSLRPHPNQSRWRFSTRQQTYGPVDVQINIRGRGGCRCTVPYHIVLTPGGHECNPESLPVFIEKRPHQKLKPMKMMDTRFALTLYFELDASAVAPASSMIHAAKSIYSRSKLPILVEEEEGQICQQYFANKQTDGSKAWLVKLLDHHTELPNKMHTTTATANSCVMSISSPDLTGGHGLNECYKIIEGLPDDITSTPTSANASVHVRIDVSTLSTQQIVKVAQNFVKYEEAMDSFFPYHRREDRCINCRSNKQAIDRGDTNKERNQQIAKCQTVQELIDCMMNPAEEGYQYKLNLRNLVRRRRIHNNNVVNNDNNTKQTIEFRQHPSSKDKTTITHWIRFCTAFVRNSARLRSPTALKSTTSIEEEFDLLFEYVVKDRALRNFYRERRDRLMVEEDEERQRMLLHEQLLVKKACGSNDDSMSISDSNGSSSDGSALHIPSDRKRSGSDSNRLESTKRACF